MTIGTSPKAILPAIALVTAGALVIVAGVLIADSTVTTIGVTLIAAAGVQLPVAYQAQPGNVRAPEADEPSDDLLHAALTVEQRAKLDAA